MTKLVAQEFVVSSDLDLPEAWKQTLQECSKIAGWDLGGATPISVEAQSARVKGIIETISPPKASAEKTGRVREVFGDALSCLQVFGGFVAQGASVVSPILPKCF